MDSRQAKNFRRLITVLLFIFDLYWLYFSISLLFLACCFFATNYHWFGVFLVGSIQFGIIGFGSKLASNQYKPLKELKGMATTKDFAEVIDRMLADDPKLKEAVEKEMAMIKEEMQKQCIDDGEKQAGC